MKQLKYIFPRYSSWQAGICILTLILLSSCNPDDDVETAIRDDYLGTWQSDEFDQNQTFIATFQVQITNHSSDNSKVLIDNFNQLGFGIQAEAIIDNTSITLPQQLVDGNSIIGSGFMSNKLKTIELQYNVDDGSGQPESITATYTKL